MGLSTDKERHRTSLKLILILPSVSPGSRGRSLRRGPHRDAHRLPRDTTRTGGLLKLEQLVRLVLLYTREESLYRKVQSVRRDRSHGATKIKREFLLKGLIRWADCGSAMTPHYTQKRHKDGSVNCIPYYRCTRTIHFNNAACSVKHINADHLENLVVGKLSELSQNDAYLKMSVAEMNGDLKRKVGRLQKEAQQVRNRLKEIDQEIGPT